MKFYVDDLCRWTVTLRLNQHDVTFVWMPNEQGFHKWHSLGWWFQGYMVEYQKQVLSEIEEEWSKFLANEVLK